MSSVAIPVRAKSLGSADNLRALFAKATAEDIKAGEEWYVQAKDACIEIASEYRLPLMRVVRAMAALSPRTEWNYNIRALHQVARMYAVGTRAPDFPGFTPQGTVRDLRKLAAAFPLTGLRIVRDNILKALWELDGIEVLQGPKVNAFAHNILNPATSQHVTVDSHYVMAWLGLTASGSYQFPSAWYADIVNDTTVVASEYGYSPLVFQAILWCTKKRIQDSASSDAAAVFAALE